MSKYVRYVFVGSLFVQTISHLNFYVIPVILIGFFSFLVAHCFLSVYEASTAVCVLAENCI